MFLKSALSFAKLEYRALRFYPSSFVLTIVRSFVTTGMWLSVSLFLKDYAAASLAEYGGDFVSYMVIGVVFFQSASVILTLPYESVNTAFWDKRLEVYNASAWGIWAFITGRFLWTFTYQLIIQAAVLTVAVLFADVKLSLSVPVLPLFVYYAGFLFTCFGFGLMGAGNFFTLEVKQGREPLTWLTDILARIFSGIYYPLSVLPSGLRFISNIVPHTWAFRGIRLIMINGAGFGHADVLKGALILSAFAAVSMSLGILTLNRALDRAQKGNGVGMIV